MIRAFETLAADDVHPPHVTARGMSGARRLALGPCRTQSSPGRKADLYLHFGVPYYWIVDPDERTLEAFEAKAEAWVRLGAWSDGDRPRIPPFDAIEPDVGGLFTPLS